LSPRPGALLTGALRLRALEADAVHVWLAPAPDEAPEPWTPWPDLLPSIPLPFELSAQTATVAGLRITRGDEEIFALSTLTAQDLSLEQQGLRVAQLQGAGDWGHASLQGHYQPADDFRTELGGQLRL